MKWRMLVLFVASVLLASGLSFSADERGRIILAEGEVTLIRGLDGAESPAHVDDGVEEGDGLLLGEGSFASVQFSDGGQLDISGPAHVRIRLLKDHARTIELVYGRINRLIAREVTTGVITACDVFVSFRNGSLFMLADTSGEPHRVTVKLFEGADAVVGQGTQSSALSTEKPLVFECTSCCPAPGDGAAVYVPAPGAVWPLAPIPPVHRREIYDDPLEDPGDSSFIGDRR